MSEFISHQEAARTADDVQTPATDTTEPILPTGWPLRIVLAMIRGVPTLIVLALLAGLAMWGHHSGWKLPSFSELTGGGQTTAVEWCDEHGVAEADCISCNAELLPKGQLFGWCDEHGVQECVLHHPQLAQLKETPIITPEDMDRAARAIAIRPRTNNDPLCKMHLRRIQFPSIDAVNRAGIDIGLVDRGPVVESVKTTGQIVYDPTRVAQLSSRANGIVSRVQINVGDQVRQGDLLALVDAVELGRVKSQLVESLVQLDLAKKVARRLTGLGEGTVPGKRIEEAQSAQIELEVAVQKTMETLSNLGVPIDENVILQRSIPEIQEELKLLGIPPAIRAEIKSSQASTNLLPIVSPRDGIVVLRSAVAGEVVDAGRPLFTIADTSLMWLQLNVRLEQAEQIAIGQKIVFHPDGTDRAAIGAVTWISTDVDVDTRTVRVRGELVNDDGNLRSETFGAGEIIIREEPNAIVVASDAIHWEGSCYVAFVRDKDYFKDGSFKVFHTRSVRPGATMGDNTEVIAGLLPGEVVVTKGSGILRAELLKGDLGAG